MTDSASDRFGLETAMSQTGLELSSGSVDRLLSYAAMLRQWQGAQNLIGPQTMKDLWTRHVADSLQLVPILKTWNLSALEAAFPENRQDAMLRDGLKVPPVGLDLGSGAGLPGLVLALVLTDEGLADEGLADKTLTGTRLSEETLTGPAMADTAMTDAVPVMHLVESNRRKAAFLRAVSRETRTPVTVQASRIEAVTVAQAPARFVTARALAPLSRLVTLAEPWLARGATAFFHKGGDTESEIAAWSDAGAYSVVQHVSVIDPMSRILQIRKAGAPA